MTRHYLFITLRLICAVLVAASLACIITGVSPNQDDPAVNPPPSETIPDTPPPAPSNTPSITRESGRETLPPANTPEPVPLSEEGPWVLFTTDIGIFITNWDGRGLSLLHAFQVTTPYVASSQIVAAPQGGRVAVIELYTMENTGLRFPVLKVIKVPSGEVELDLPLIPEDWKEEDFTQSKESDDLPLDQVFASAGVWNKITWSHDGSLLAFNAAIDGPSTDLYLYDTRDSSVTRLTDGPSYSVDPYFTPDDTFIVHGAVDTLNYGSSGYGYDYLHIWAARADNSAVTKVFDHEFYGFEKILGWGSNTEYIGASYTLWCGYFDVRAVSLNEGVTETIYWGHHDRNAYDPEDGRLVYSLAEKFSEDCSYQSEPGVYLLDAATGGEVWLPSIDHTQVTDISWHETAGLFFVATTQGALFTVAPDGTVTEYPAPESAKFEPPSISPDGERWVFLGEDTFIFGDNQGSYLEYSVSAPELPIWPGNSIIVLFFGQYNEHTAIWGSAIPGPRPLVIQPEVWTPSGIQKITLVEP